jgi:hypothetical protein
MNRRSLFALLFAPLTRPRPVRSFAHFRQVELNLRALPGLFRAPDELLRDIAGLESFIRQNYPDMVRFRACWVPR